MLKQLAIAVFLITTPALAQSLGLDDLMAAPKQSVKKPADPKAPAKPAKAAPPLAPPPAAQVQKPVDDLALPKTPQELEADLARVEKELAAAKQEAAKAAALTKSLDESNAERQKKVDAAEKLAAERQTIITKLEQQAQTAGWHWSAAVRALALTTFGRYTAGGGGIEFDLYYGKLGMGIGGVFGTADMTGYNLGERRSLYGLQLRPLLYQLTGSWTIGLTGQFVAVMKSADKPNLYQFGLGPLVAWQPWRHFAVQVELPVAMVTIGAANMPSGTPIGVNGGLALVF